MDYFLGIIMISIFFMGGGAIVYFTAYFLSKLAKKNKKDNKDKIEDNK